MTESTRPTRAPRPGPGALAAPATASGSRCSGRSIARSELPPGRRLRLHPSSRASMRSAILRRCRRAASSQLGRGTRQRGRASRSVSEGDSPNCRAYSRENRPRCPKPHCRAVLVTVVVGLGRRNSCRAFASRTRRSSTMGETPWSRRITRWNVRTLSPEADAMRPTDRGSPSRPRMNSMASRPGSAPAVGPTCFASREGARGPDAPIPGMEAFVIR